MENLIYAVTNLDTIFNFDNRGIPYAGKINTLDDTYELTLCNIVERNALSRLARQGGCFTPYENIC